MGTATASGAYLRSGCCAGAEPTDSSCIVVRSWHELCTLELSLVRSVISSWGLHYCLLSVHSSLSALYCEKGVLSLQSGTEPELKLYKGVG